MAESIVYMTCENMKEAEDIGLVLVERRLAACVNILPGAESRQQIGWVIVGGMGLGTLLTVFVVPTVYTLLSRERLPPVPLPQPAH